MSRVILFRSSPFQHEHVLRALSLSSEVVDVHDRRDLGLSRVTLDGVEVTVRNQPMHQFSHALLLGQPSPSPLSVAASRLDPTEREFEANEWAAGLSSALLLSRVKLFNRGAVSGAAASLSTKPGQVAFLAKLGWRTPSLRLTRTGVGEEIRSYGCDLGTLRKLFLCISKRYELVYPPGEAWDAFSTRELEATRRTQESLSSLQLDWLTISLAISAERVFAFGATTELPPELGDGGMAAIFSSCLCAPATDPPPRTNAALNGGGKACS